jgi:ElaB/YqjD/DUF883 family membrane-anchored ribosome-binding protein
MSTEPVVPLDNDASAEQGSRVHPQPVGELPVASDITAPQPQTTAEPSPRMRDTAETVGTAVGKAVGKVRELPRQMAELKERFTVIRGRARESATSTAEEFRQNARQRAYQARTRVEQVAHEYPLQFILAVGAAGFVLGFALRVWRSSRRD